MHDASKHSIHDSYWFSFFVFLGDVNPQGQINIFFEYPLLLRHNAFAQLGNKYKMFDLMTIELKNVFSFIFLCNKVY